MGRFVTQAFSGSVIEAVHYEGDVLGCDGIEAHFLWEELTDKSVHVFVCTAFRRGVAADPSDCGSNAGRHVTCQKCRRDA